MKPLFYRRFVDDIHDDLNVWVVLRQAPPLPFLPEDVHGKGVVVLPFFFDGDPEQGMSVIEPLRGFGQPYGEHFGPMPFCDWQKAFDPLQQLVADNCHLHRYTEQTIDSVFQDDVK